MRLVELQRASLGAPRSSIGQWDTRLHAEGSVVEIAPPPALTSAVIAVDATATPASGVIPGAIVTFALSVANEGAKPARNVRIAVPLPGGATYRNGSFMRDGVPLLDDAADEFFGRGTLVDSIASNSRTTFVWKVGVRLGNKPLVIVPSVTAEGSAVIGAHSIAVSRKADETADSGPAIAYIEPVLYRTVEAEELPIYELDEEEELIQEAADAALSAQAEYMPPMEPPLQPVPPPDQPEPAPPPGQPAPVPEPGVPVPEPTIPSPPEEPPTIEPAAREAVILAGSIDRPSLAYLERLFNGSKAPTLLNHFVFAGALACARLPSGEDAAGLKAHVDAQGQILQRVALHEKLGKKEPIAEYAGKFLANPAELCPMPVIAAEPQAGMVLLEVELEKPQLGVLLKMQNDNARWDFTKARQFTLAVQAQRAVADAPQARIDAANEALRMYAQTSATQLQRFFVRMRLDRTTGLLFAHDEVLDNAARAAIAALMALFTA
jgi:uncharacterized repeat protein (TIGR01451 family)